MIMTKSVSDKIKEMPMLSVVASRLLELSGDEEHSLQDVAKIVENDAYLTTRILRVVNSAAFAPNSPITTVAKAILNIGEKMVMGIAVGSCSAKVFKDPLDGYEAAAGGLWDHSLRTAIAAREIANYSKREISASLAFTAGLLHDIGKSVISEFLVGNTEMLTDMCDEGKAGDFLDAERTLVGTDHSEVGQQLAVHWGIPQPLVESIRYHHRPEQASEENKHLVYSVHLSDLLAMMGGSGTGADSLAYKIDDNYESFIDIGKDQLAVLLLKVQEEFFGTKKSIFGSEEF